MAAKRKPIVTADVTPALVEKASGGIEGAERTTRELLRWTPPIISPDQQVNPGKDLADARGRDMVQNDGYAQGAVNTHRDSIVGSQYRLNAQPEWELLGATQEWADEFQSVVEPMFNLIADSHEGWFDAAGAMTLTDIIRLDVTGFLMTGEVLSSVEWIRDITRPCSTAIQAIHPSRLCNPDYRSDERNLRKGVVTDFYGKATGYWIRAGYQSEFYDDNSDKWKLVPATKPWGRRQIIHIKEALQPGQTRGISDMVSVLKTMKMTRKFQDLTLQKAVIAASYAAAIESELPKEMIFNSMGGTGNGLNEMLTGYMDSLTSFLAGAQNIKLDDSKIPHLFPGTTLKALSLGDPSGVGSDFETSLLRHTSAALGLSYEQFAKDYSKGNYAGIRASIGESNKYFLSRKKVVADRKAAAIYYLVMEEWINKGKIPLPKGMDAGILYDPIMREALLNHTWVGAPKGQIDEMKETQAAILRVDNHFSTLEDECAAFGKDWRKVLRQNAREKKMKKELGLDEPLDATKPGANDRQKVVTGGNKNE